MKQRVDVGTDVAQIGAWDVARDRDPLPKLSLRQLDEAIAADSRAGHLFLLQLEGDWGGPVDVYVDSAMDPEHAKLLERLPGDFLLSVPSGRIVVGGVEDYRSTQPRITSESSVVEMPPGEYGLHGYRLKSEHAELPDRPSPEAIRKRVGDEAYSHYESRTRARWRGVLLLLLVVPLGFWLGFPIAAVVTVILVVGYFRLLDWRHRRDPKSVAAEKAVEAAIAEASAQMPPAFALILSPLDAGHHLAGGVLDLSSTE